MGSEMCIRDSHHALEAGCFVINATGWLTEDQITSISDDPKLQKGLRDGCMTCMITPEGRHIVPPLTEGEGILVADLDMKLITKRKRMMDSVGHYARPELLHLVHNTSATQPRDTVGLHEPNPIAPVDLPTEENPLVQ